MNGLREKFRNKKGFTLIEMLIVVAIIAILIAISIPLVGNALERAREATDAANERAFKAELIVCYLAGTVDGTENGDAFTTSDTPNYYYDAANGALVLSTATDAAKTAGTYGQGTKDAGQDPVARKDGYLTGCVNGDGEVTMKWSNDATGSLTSEKLMGK